MTAASNMVHLNEARETIVSELVESIDSFHVTGVTGESEVGKTTLVRRALESKPDVQAVVLDLDAAYSPNQLMWQWARRLAVTTMGRDIALGQALALPEQMWSGRMRGSLIKVEQRFGPRISRLVEQPHPDGGRGDLSLVADLMHATITSSHDRTVVLVVDHLEAPGLSFRHPLNVRDLLWSIRAVSQQAVDLRIVLIGRPPAVELATGDNAAFYGDGQWLRVSRPTASEFSAATDSPIPLVEDILRYTAGHIQTSLELLQRVSQRRRLSIDASAAELALEQSALRDRTLQHARSVHRLGSHLVQEIAFGRGPYEATPDALSKDVSAAMRQLHLAGIMRRPDDTQSDWELTDPRVAWGITGSPIPLRSY